MTGKTSAFTVDSASSNYDFCSKPAEEYDQVFKGLSRIVQHRATDLRFACDFEGKDTATLNQSIRIRKPLFSHWLAKILLGKLPRAKRLTSLTLSNIEFKDSSICQIIEGIGHCLVLREVQFDQIRLSDEPATILFKEFSPYRLTRLALVDCHISSSVERAVIDFLKAAPHDTAIDWKLTELNLGRNHFNAGQLSKFARLLLKNHQPDGALPSFPQAAEPLPGNGAAGSPEKGEEEEEEEEAGGEGDEGEEEDYPPEGNDDE